LAEKFFGQIFMRDISYKTYRPNGKNVGFMRSKKLQKAMLHLTQFWFINSHRKCFTKSTSGVDVMITMFGDFCQFSAQKIGVFSKKQCYVNIFAKTGSIFESKTPIFSPNIFGENIQKSWHRSQITVHRRKSGTRFRNFARIRTEAD
jgi:hypothetical protein